MTVVFTATGITRPYDLSFFGGPPTSGTRTDVGTIWDVALAGRGYMLDKAPEGGGPGYSFKTLPLLQRYFLTQQSGNLGEQSINPDDYWRRSVDSWTNGAGQAANDHDTSIRNAFRSSKGIDPWTPGLFTLLKDTTQVHASANANLQMVMCGVHLYVLDGGVLSYTDDGFTYHVVTGPALNAPASICSDGYTVWIVDVNDTYYTTRTATTYTTWFASPRPGTLVRTSKGRLFVTDLNVIYTSSGVPGSAVSTAFYTHPNSDFAWVDVTDGPTAIYFAGFSGQISHIYQTAVVPDGTNLTIPTNAATLPDGEIVRSALGYLGVMMIGSDLGVRVAAIDSQGNLTVGDLIATAPVRCFEPQSHFVWFGWSNYDTTSTGIGRVDLGTFNDSAPAYASDLMATGQGSVVSVVTFLGRRAFAVAGLGIFAEHAVNFVASGNIRSGTLNYGLPDPKIAIKYDIAASRGKGTVDTLLAVDEGPFGPIGGTIQTSGVTSTHTIQPAGLQTGLIHEVELVLTRDTDPTQCPVIDRWTLMVNPAPVRRRQIMAWLDLHRQLESVNGAGLFIEPQFERDVIDGFLQTNEVVTWQDSQRTYRVTVDDYEWRGVDQVDPTQRVWEGSLLLTMNVID